MSGHTANVVCFVIVLMTSRQVTGQAHDVAQLNKRLTFIKTSVDRDISDIRFQILELKMIVEQILVDQRNASDGSLIGGPFIGYGQEITGVHQNEIADLKTKLTTLENRLNTLSSTVSDTEVDKKATEMERNELIENLKAELLTKFEETVTVIIKGYRDLKTHVNLKESLVYQIHNLSQSVISEQNKLSARIDQADAKVVSLESEVNNLEVDELVEKKKRNELMQNFKAELVQLNAEVETKCNDRVNVLQKRFEETTAVNMAGYKDLETHMSDQITKLKTKTDKCCISSEGTDCPDGWLAFEGSCYLFADLPANFTEAAHYCQHHGGSLIHVDSVTENDFIRNYLRGLRRSSVHRWWLGLTDKLEEGQWRWMDVNKPATFLDWAPNEPHGGAEDCAAFIPHIDFHWADVLCNRLDIIPLCEIRVSQETLIVG